MSLTTTDPRYTKVAVVLHWAIAACILFNLTTGLFMESLKGGPKHIVVSAHVSSGLTVLVLSLVRIAWRLGHKPPPFDETLSRVERRLAEAVHGLLYVLMIVVPFAGWAISSASTRKGAGASLYFLTSMPKLWFLKALPTPEKVVAHDNAVLAHQIGAWILMGLLVAHVAGALKHQFVDRQPQFARMWFLRPAPEPEA